MTNVTFQNPSISVVIPIYNMEQYVGLCIESVLKQDFENFELILVNDGSTDHSLAIAQSYAQKDKRIKVIDKQNGGLGSAYNAGQSVACGKYIYFLDSDDWMGQNCLKTLYDIAENTDAEIVKSWGFITEQYGVQKEHRMIPLNKCNRVITNMLSIPEFVSRHVAQWTCLYRRDFLLKNNIWSPEFPPKLAPDIDFMYHVWSKCKRLYVLSKSFIHYRTDNANSDKNSGAKMSFYLLKGHLVARATMANLFLPKAYWYVKTKIEYQHFMYELDTNRCSTNKKEYLIGISKIFLENLKHGLVDFKNFLPYEIKLYKLIAHFPRLYWLNLVSHFWTKSSESAKNKII